MMIQNDYSRQVNILNPEEFNTKINIIFETIYVIVTGKAAITVNRYRERLKLLSIAKTDHKSIIIEKIIPDIAP